jgi:6-pyruvoyltetrahydropterin/6-carboxytetrahydropterin synthase
MFELTIIVDFAAAHCLPEYPGKCRRLHGHNWKVEVTVQGEKLDKLSMLVDFGELKKQVNSVIETLDHHYLNEIEPFKQQNPTAENIACYIYERMDQQFPATTGIQVQTVKIWESTHSAALYRRG